MDWTFLHDAKIPFLLLVGSLAIGGPIVAAILAATRRRDTDHPGDGGGRPLLLPKEAGRDAP